MIILVQFQTNLKMNMEDTKYLLQTYIKKIYIQYKQPFWHTVSVKNDPIENIN